MKSIALLTIALFFASAPSPDSQVISEITAGFLVSNKTPVLMAAELQQPDQKLTVIAQATDETVQPEELAD